MADRAGRFLYVTNRDTSTIAVFAINPSSGALTPVAGSPFAVVDLPFGLAMHPNGTHAIVSSVSANAVYLLRLDPGTGRPSLVSGPFAVGTAPGKILINAAGTLAFVANQFSRNVSVLSIDVANATLTPVAGSPFDTGGDWVYQMALHPRETMLFVSNYDSGTVTAFRVGAAGALLATSGTPVAAGVQTYGVTVDSSGTHVYAASGGSGKIYGFDIDNTRQLIAPMNAAPFDSGGTHGMATDPSGRTTIVAHFGSDTISTLTADGSGMLIQRQQQVVGTQPLTIGFAVTTG